MLIPTILAATAVLSNAAPLEKRQEAPSGVPDFVVKYAPIVHLFSTEPYLPSDISAQLANTKPYINLTAVTDGVPSPLTLDNLNELNNIPNSSNGTNIYLTSLSDPTTDPRPQYLYGVKPDSSGKTEHAISSAIITVSKPNNTLDAFYFYFYAFDFGGVYFGANVGNHVGDWEYNMIRFVDGEPMQIFFSQHSGGQAFEYSATEKFGSTGRAVTYVANGTHANYAMGGDHDRRILGVDLPEGLIEDHTDDGVVWDPVLSAYFYGYDVEENTFTPYGEEPVGWLSFSGHWGDDGYAKSDSRQDCLLGISALCRYTGGPTGPLFKDLDRTNVCPDGEECVVSSVLLPRRTGEGRMMGG